jgi:hypothetical protein
VYLLLSAATFVVGVVGEAIQSPVEGTILQADYPVNLARKETDVL